VAIRAGAVQQQLAMLRGQVLPRGLDVDPVRLGHRLQQPPVVRRRRLGPRQKGALRDRKRGVGDDQLRVDHPLKAEPVAALAAPVRRVEGEDPGLELRHRGAAGKTREPLTEQQRLAHAAVWQGLDLHQPLRKLRGRLDRLRQALSHPLLHHQPVDDDRDIVLELLVELDRLIEPA
jgi:hypothetical protein